MGRRGGPLAGATALTLGLALLTGCGTPGSPHHTSASPSGTPAADLCATIVAHWSRAVLGSGTYGDYQSMGLSNGQYEILRNAVDAARAAKRSRGTAAADRLIDSRSRAACADRHRHGAPTEDPWR